MAYVALTIEGGLFPADLLDRLADGSAPGQRPEDFGLAGTARLSDEMQAAFSDARAFWDAFQRRLARPHESTFTLTRQAWVEPLLERLGWTLHPVRTRRAGEAALQRPYTTGPDRAAADGGPEDDGSPPVHAVGVDTALDRRSGSISPHAALQQFLNHSDALWGLVTNGDRLRLLRDSARMSRPTFLEFDLRAIVEGNLYSEFVLLYRLLHRSRFPRGGDDADACLLERLYQQGIDEGGRVRERLREGVEEALRELGSAFLTHPDSAVLREAVRSGRLDEGAYYRQLLRLIYRLLFLMTIEERRLVFPADGPGAAAREVYGRHYSVARLRDRCERPFAGDGQPDLWQGLRQTFRIFREDGAARALGLTPLDGELFGGLACADLEGAGCTNERLLRAVRRLSTFRDGRVHRRVNYAALDVEELGSVYESLLEYRPDIAPGTEGGAPTFDLLTGSERKQTGSYYTPPALVQQLIGSALVPVVQERLAAARGQEAKVHALLDLRVIDPASGSGHFLLAAARRIARELAVVRTGEAEPTPEAYRQALRDVIRQCIYAVDRNPLAVDLCKVALWLEGHNAGLPLSFLDNHIKLGDSLVGVFDLEVLRRGIPDEAFAALTGDDKAVATALKRRNKIEREGVGLRRGKTGIAGQHSFAVLEAVADAASDPTRQLAPEFAALGEQDERTPDDVHGKQALYEELRAQGGRWWTYKVACDLWTAAFFLPKTAAPGGEALVPTTDQVRQYLLRPHAIHGQLVGEAVGAAVRLRFFHWPLEFPEVFARGGFDVVLGNPPWERIKLQEQEFFAGRDLAIAHAPNKAARDVLIKTLPQRLLALAREFEEAKHDAEGQSGFVRGGGRFPLCGRGDVNTYSVFAETMRALLGPAGRAGVIVPSGIATDDTTKFFFADLMQSRALVSLYDFENAVPIFAGVHRSYKFCLLTLTGSDRPAAGGAMFAFFLHRTDDLREPGRCFLLSAADLALLNPNTHTCPIFRTERDAELTKAIYRRVPVLIAEGPPEVNPWGIHFSAMFHMSNDSGLFRTREQLEAEDWRLDGNIFRRGGAAYLPLYEAKLLHHFDHRFATYDGLDTRDTVLAEKANPSVTILPRYWVPAAEVDARLAGRWDRGWLLGWRDICRSTDERTVIASVLPRVGVGNNFPIMLLVQFEAVLVGALAANLSSFVLDFSARFKVGGTHLNFFIANQLPVLPPATYEQNCPWSRESRIADWLLPRVIELSYTAHDLTPFARDLERRFR